MKLQSLRDVLDWFCDSHHSCGTCDFHPQDTCVVWWLKSKIDDKIVDGEDPLFNLKRDMLNMKMKVAKLEQKACQCGEPKLYTGLLKDNVEMLKKLGKELFEP